MRYNSFIHSGRTLNETQVIDEVREISSEMLLRRIDLEEIYGIAGSHAGQILSTATGKTHGDRVREFVLKEHSNGRETHEIATLAGLGYSAVYKYINQDGSGVSKDRIKKLSDIEIDRLVSRSDRRGRMEIEEILKGSTITQIGKMFEYTREYARQKIMNYGLYQNWMEARKILGNQEVVDIPPYRQEFIDLIKERKKILAAAKPADRRERRAKSRVQTKKSEDNISVPRNTEIRKIEDKFSSRAELLRLRYKLRKKN